MGNKHFKQSALSIRSPSGGVIRSLRDNFPTLTDLHIKANELLTEKPGHPDGLAAKALAFIDDGEFNLAADLLKGAMRKSASHARTRLGLAKLKIIDNKYYAARRHLEIATRGGTNDRDVFELLESVNDYISRHGAFEPELISPTTGRAILKPKVK